MEGRKLDTLLKDSEIEIIDSEYKYIELEKKYGIPFNEIRYIDFNRTGVFLPNKEVKIGFRARFVTHINTLKPRKTYFALPVRGKNDTNFSVCDNELGFKDNLIGITEEVCLDTCDTSYSRGPNLLNLNSRRRGNCGGCNACVHNYKDLYDSTVLKDDESLVTHNQISSFFDFIEKNGFDISKLEQIAVVTGLFHGEENVLEHMSLIRDVVAPRGFSGELLYFGCEVNSLDALKQLRDLGNVALIYAVDNFTKRNLILNPLKARISLKDAKRTMETAKNLGIETTYSYIIGIDDLERVENETKGLVDMITRFPIINIYQVQTQGQVEVMDIYAKKLGYYVEARMLFEDIFGNKNFKPRRWENFRPLWYDLFKCDSLED